MSGLKLGDLIEIKHGYAFSGQHFCADGPFVLLTPGNFYDAGGFKFRADQKHYDGPAPSDFILNEGDLLVAMTEQGEGLLGSAAFVPNGKKCLHNQRLGLVSPKARAEVDLRYVYYLLNSRNVRQQIRATASGAKVRHTSPSRIYAVTIPEHSIETQRRIASILGAYDDLIEVNRRRIAVLEEMARGLFELWFIRFRFPGHEAVPILDTQDGPLPEGWISQTVGDTFELLGGGTPSKAELTYWTDGTIDWFTPSDLTKSKTLFMDRSGDRITPLGLAKSSAKLFPADSIMMTSRATIGEISICTCPASTNQGFITCLPNDAVPRSYLYFWLLQNVPLFIAHATGATFKEITKGVFKRLPITVPQQPISAQFDEQVRPMHDMILVLERSNRSLSASRDLLLPRLISGQLSVAEATRELEEAA